MDHRRRNTSEESLELNVNRLKEYKAKLIVFPRKTRGKKGEKKMAVDVLHPSTIQLMKKPDASTFQDNILPPLALPTPPVAITERKIEESEKEGSQYVRLRKARSDARLVGKREKRAKQKAEDEAAKGKK